MSARAWRPPASPLVIDALIAAAATVLVQTAIWAGVGVSTDGRAGAIAGRPLLLALLFAPATVALLWRRRCPLAAVGLWAAAVGIQALSTHNTPEGTAILLPTFAAVYSLGAHGTRRQALVALPALVAGLALHGANDRAIGENAFAAAFYWLAIAAFYAIGLLVQARRRDAALRERAARARAESEAAARAAVADERARIARELHDAVARSVSVTVIHAEAAEEVLPAAGSGPARASLQRIQDSGREALTEIRQMLGLLRSDEAGESLAPQPGLADLGRLCEAMDAAGLPVELVVAGDTGDLPPGIDVSAYRIAQEALNNSLKHGARDARVEVHRDSSGLTIDIRDRAGSAISARAGTPLSGGQGLIGIKERVRFFGGQFTAGPLEGGGFGVSARLPVPETRVP